MLVRSEDEERLMAEEVGRALLAAKRRDKAPAWLDTVLIRALEMKYGPGEPAAPDPKEND